MSTTLSAAANAGDSTFDVTLATGIVAGEFLQLSTGTGTEVIKVGGIATNTVTLDAAAHPNGLRKAHANGAAVVGEDKTVHAHDLQGVDHT